MSLYEPTTGLVVVDMQNAFVDPAGLLHVSGGTDVAAVINAEVGAAVAAPSPVWYTQDRQPVPSDRYQAGSADWQVAMYPGLRIAGPVVDKGPGADGGFSGFVCHNPVSGHRDESRLARLLRQAGVVRLIVVGLAADVCVKQTALDAVARGYQVTVPLRAARFVHAHPGGDEATIADLTAAGVTVESASAG